MDQVQVISARELWRDKCLPVTLSIDVCGGITVWLSSITCNASEGLAARVWYLMPDRTDKQFCYNYLRREFNARCTCGVKCPFHWTLINFTEIIWDMNLPPGALVRCGAGNETAIFQSCKGHFTQLERSLISWQYLKTHRKQQQSFAKRPIL